MNSSFYMCAHTYEYMCAHTYEDMHTVTTTPSILPNDSGIKLETKIIEKKTKCEKFTNTQ